MKTEREKIPVTIELYKDQVAKFFALCYYLKSELGRKLENPVASSNEPAEPLADVDLTSIKELFEEIPMAGCSTEATLEFLMNCIHIPQIDAARSDTSEEADTDEQSSPSDSPGYEAVQRFILSMTELKRRLLESDRTKTKEDSELHYLTSRVIEEIREGNIHFRKRDDFWYAASLIPPGDLPIPSEIYLDSLFTHQFGVRLDPYEFIEKLRYPDKKYIVNKVYNGLLSSKILREFPYQTRVLTGFVCSHILEGFCPFNQYEGKHKKSRATWKKELEKSVARMLEPEENLEQR